MQLSCENCGAEFAQGKVSRKLRFAVCGFCGTLHNIALITAERAGRPYVPPPLFLPDGMTVEHMPGGVRLVFRERNPSIPIGAVAGFMLSGAFLITCVPAWILAPHYVDWRLFWQIVNLATVPPILYGIYLTIALLVNRVETVVTTTEIVSRKRPLPGLSGSRVALSRIKAIHARGRQLGPQSERKEYSLQLISGDGREFSIGAGYDEPEIADAIKHFVLQAIGLESPPESMEAPKGQTRILNARVREPKVPSKIELACRSCGAPIPLREVRKEALAARCAQCGVVQDARAFLRHGIVRPRRNPGFHAPWVVDVGPKHLTVASVVKWDSYRGLLPWIVPSGLSTLALIPLGLLGYWMVFSMLAPFSVIAAVFGYAFWQAIQTQRVVVNADGLLMQRGPLRALRATSVGIRDAAQIVSLSPTDSGTLSGFGLMLITRDHQRVPLLDGLHDWEHVLYLEQEMERILNIRQVAVPAARRHAP